MTVTKPSLRRVGAAALSGMTDREVEADPARAFQIAQSAMRAVVQTAVRTAPPTLADRLAHYVAPDKLGEIPDDADVEIPAGLIREAIAALVEKVAP